MTKKGMIEFIIAILIFFIIAKTIGYLISSINYVIDDQYLKIRIGSKTFRKISIDDIAEVEIGARHGGENWTNTIHKPTILKKAVTFHRRSGLFRILVITPDDPEDFAEKIKAHPRYRVDT